MKEKLTTSQIAMFMGSDCKIIQAIFPYEHKRNFAKVGDVVKIDIMLLLLMNQIDIEVKPVLRKIETMTDFEVMALSGCFEHAIGMQQFFFAIRKNGEKLDLNISELSKCVNLLRLMSFDTEEWIEKDLAICQEK